MATWRREPFYVPTTIDYLCGLAARYASRTMPPRWQQEKPGALFSYALWLSMIWLIDGMLDSGYVADLAHLTALLTPETNQDPIEPLTDAFHSTIAAIKQRYDEVVRPYRLAAPWAYAANQRWLGEYLRRQSMPPPRDISEYTTHRLADGGMMCVLHQLLMYGQVPQQIAESVPPSAMHHPALIVSYHNDLLSLDRDLRQNTPNIVQYMSPIRTYDKFTAAIHLLDDLSRQFREMDLPSVLTEIYRGVVAGSHTWALAEPRYRRGVELFAAWQDGDQEAFYQHLDDGGYSPGDPR